MGVGSHFELGHSIVGHLYVVFIHPTLLHIPLPFFCPFLLMYSSSVTSCHYVFVTSLNHLSLSSVAFIIWKYLQVIFSQFESSFWKLDSNRRHMRPNYVPRLTQKINGLSVCSTRGSPGTKNKVPLKIISVHKCRTLWSSDRSEDTSRAQRKRELSAGPTNMNKRPTTTNCGLPKHIRGDIITHKRLQTKSRPRSSGVSRAVRDDARR